MSEGKNIIWAPWRGAYVTGPKSASGCVFCQKILEQDDRRNLVLHRGAYTAAIMNLYPYNNGHVMIIPLRHTSDILSLTDEESAEMVYLRKILIQVLNDTMRSEAFNVGMNLGKAAGAGVADHLHEHIVPRWHGDTNFMPVIAGTKVISEHMSQTYDKMHAAILEKISK